MSNFPNAFDDDTTLPFVNNDITQLGAVALDAQRDAIFAIEQNIGLNAQGTTNSLAERLGVSLDPAGRIIPSAIASLGLVTLPITEDQIASFAQIPESKLKLDYRTQDLFNYIRDLSGDVNVALGWVSASGVKLEPHLIGALYRHSLNQIDVSENSSQFLSNNLRVLRDNTQSYALINDINNELLAHQWADGSPFGVIKNITTNNGSVYANNYGHTASGIFLNTSRFVTIPQNNDDLQLFADYIDSSNILLLGTRIQNLYASGISRNSRSSSLMADGYGQSLIPPTPAIAFLLNNGVSSSPVDSIVSGDDIIQFTPPSSVTNNNLFDEQFSLVRPGDIIRINYNNGVEVQFVISEKKYQQDDSGNKSFIVRILGKNLAYTTSAVARIDRPLFNNNKYGVLAIAAANNQFDVTPSLIVGSPRGAQALGLDFDSEQFDSTHYNLYLALYPDGIPQDGYVILPAIDVTGNKGASPGSYTLDGIVENTNNALRTAGYNYRFIAFSYGGEFGIMLADSYNNASFSILSACVTPEGVFDQLATHAAFTNNVVDVFAAGALTPSDPLGFGLFNANIASPPYMGVAGYGSAQAAVNSTLLFAPLKRNNYYINGIELERLNIQIGQALDGYGDGYWVGTISSQTIVPSPTGRVQNTYSIPLDLASSDLKVGKTLVIQSLGTGNFVDEGRFIIQSITFVSSPTPTTFITVYDAVHAVGSSPAITSIVGTQVAIYFNSDSVGFNTESATDFVAVSPFKRYFEVLADGNSNTFTHERARIIISGSSPVTVNDSVLHTYSELAKLNIIEVSPKLRGYVHGSVTKISLTISSFNNATGLFTGYLSNLSDLGTTFTNQGPIITGKQGQITRFFDESNIDYIDILFDFVGAISSFTNQSIDFQLFPSLSLDEELMLLASCQVNDSSNVVNYITDQRQFGNISEEELSSSALNYISAPERLLHFNGVIRGIDLAYNGSNPNPNGAQIYLTGGVVLVNGKLISVNNQTFTIPTVYEIFSSVAYPINWVLCVNDAGELETIVLTDYDNVANTPNHASNRIVTVLNTVSTVSYQVDSDTFSSILNDRKDLTVLYIVSSSVSGSSVSLTLRDVRRYVNDSDSNTPAILTNDSSQGNFKSLATALYWLKFNSEYQDTLLVKGPYTIPNDPGLNFPLTITGISDSALLTFSGPMNISNVSFSNLTILFSSTLTTSNVTFDNCIITFTGTPVLVEGFISNSSSVVDVSGAPSFSNFDITNSNITFGGVTSFTNVSVTNSSVITFNASTTLNTSSINDSTINFTKPSVLNTVNIENATLNVGGILTTSQSTMRDTTSNVTVTQGFNIGSFDTFHGCSFVYSANPVGTGTYSTNDLVNANSGLMYANVTSNLLNVIIRDCIFTTTLPDHYPLISFQLTAYVSILQDVIIANNQFISQTTSNDIRAAVAFTSTLTGTVGTYPAFPKLVNVIVDNNLCNNDQIILVSALRNLGSPMAGSMLVATNCRINGNTCGTIGFITAGTEESHVINSDPANNNFVRDKKDHLIISQNTCKLITNLDSVGSYIPFDSTGFPAYVTSPTDWVQVPTGAVSIINNTANWIQVGSSGYDGTSNDGVIISYNKVSPFDPIYLTNYTDTGNTGITPSNVGILLRREKSAATFTQNIISNNIITQKPLTETNGSKTTFYYVAGIVCFTNAQITGNTVIGILSATIPGPMIYLWSVGTMTVTGNNLNRAGQAVQSYITGQTSATNSVMITGNTFDSPYIDVANTNEAVGLNIPSGWIYNGNKNQTSYISIPISELNNDSTALAIPTTGQSVDAITQYSVATAANPLLVSVTGNISKYIPNGVTLLYSVMGLSLFSAGATLNTSTPATAGYTLNLQKTAIFTVGSFAGSLADNVGTSYNTGSAAAASNVLSIASSGAANTLHTTTSYMFTDLTALSPIWVSGQNISLDVTVSGDFNAASSSTATVAYSPLLVKFRW
jgi:hypothetical protein